MKEPSHVLLVEDQILDADLAVREIKDSLPNCIFHRVETRKEYLKAISEFQPDLILCSDQLNQFSGNTALKMAFENLPEIPFLIWGKSLNEDNIVNFLKAGAVNYINKENSGRLKNAVLNAIGERAKHIEQSKQKALTQAAVFRDQTYPTNDECIPETNQGMLLAESISFNESILNSLHEQIVVLDSEGFIISANASWRNYVNENRINETNVSYIGRNYLELASNSFYQNKEDAGAANLGIRSVLNGTLPDYDLEYQHNLGKEERWLGMQVKPLYGFEKGIVISQVNITKRKLMERQANFDRKDKDALINSTKDLIWSVNKDFQLVAANESFFQMTNEYFKIQIARGDLFLNERLFSSEEKTFWSKLYEATILGESQKVELYLPPIKHARNLWLDIVLNPIWSNKEIIGIACFAKDITDRKEKEESLHNLSIELRESKEKIENSYKELTYQKYALDQHAIVAVTDANGTIEYANEKFSTLSKYSIEELIGRNHRILKSGYHSDDFYKEMYNTITKGNVWKGEFCNRAKDGGLYWVNATIIPFMDTETNKPIRYIVIRTDITQLKKQEQEKEQFIVELTKNNSDLLEFSYIISHNLRAPLSNLLGLLSLLEELEINDEYLTQIFHGFRLSTNALNRTLSDLHKIIVIRNQPSIVQEEINLTDLTETVLDKLNDLLIEIQPSLEFDFGIISSIRFNRVYLESIFLNLFTNAIKYREPSRRLEISLHTEYESGDPLLVFEDNGIGIDVDRYKDRLFGLYQRFHDNPESKGFGLFLMKSQIESLGGSIRIESTVNVGTRLKIKFPRIKK